MGKSETGLKQDLIYSAEFNLSQHRPPISSQQPSAPLQGFKRVPYFFALKENY